MPLVAIPNVSASDRDNVSALRGVIEASEARVLDVHVDGDHGRTVFTCTAPDEELVTAMTALAVEASARIDLQAHRGVHPRVGGLEVSPFVP